MAQTASARPGDRTLIQFLDILKYIPYTPARRRHKVLSDLKSRRHYDDDLLSREEKEAFDRAISQLENAPAGKQPEKEAVKA